MVSDARLSPASRHVPNLTARIERLMAYETWGNVNPVPLKNLVDTNLWSRHWDNYDRLIKMMEKSQKTADVLKAEIERRYMEISNEQA